MNKNIFDWFGYSAPLPDRYRMIAQAGFDGVSIWWGDEFTELYGPKERYPELADKAGLKVVSAHLPYEHAGQIWSYGLDGQELLEQYMEYVQGCAKQGIASVVLHLSDFKSKHILGHTGLERLKRLADAAGICGVKLAAENLNCNTALEYALERIDAASLGLCYDSGHANISGGGSSLLERYAHRLFALHLHDNNATVDQHLLPGEGNIDWEVVGTKIADVAYCQGILLEVQKPYPPTDSEPPQAYLKRAYDSAQRLEEVITNTRHTKA